MNRRLQFLLAVLSVVLVLVAWFFLAWKPQTDAVRSARASVASATASQTRLDTELGTLRAEQRALPDERTALKRSLAALPVATSVPTLIDEVNEDALSSGVSWTQESQTLQAPQSSSTAATPTPTSAVEDISLDFTVQGTYPQVRSFLTKLDAQPRLVVVQSLTYTVSNGLLSVSITAEAFYDPTAPTGTLSATPPSSDAST